MLLLFAKIDILLIFFCKVFLSTISDGVEIPSFKASISIKLNIP